MISCAQRGHLALGLWIKGSLKGRLLKMKSKKTSGHHKLRSFFQLLNLTLILLIAVGAAGQVYADEQDGVTIISGTPGADIITVTIDEIIDAQADIETEASEKVEAAATGIDSLGGGDTITVSAPINAASVANALLLQTPESKAEAVAKSTGITSGTGNDSISNSALISVLGSSFSAYGTALQFEQSDPANSGDQNSKKEIDASVAAKTETTGVVTGDGADSIENDVLMTINGLATSGGVAGDLTATVRESTTMKTTSASEVTATGIQAGGDNDTIINDGVFTTTATATSAALAVGLVAPGDTTPPSDKKANIKTESNATSKATVTGIHGDEDETENNLDDSSPFDLNGLRVTYEKSMITISGDDTIINNALQSGNATATSGAGAGSISNKVNGSVQTEAKAEADATVTGINGGGGSDVIVNSGELLSTASARSGALAVAVEVGAADETPPAPPPASDPPKPPVPSKDKQSKSSTDASATANATATGITADGYANSMTSTWVLELIDNTLTINYRKVVAYLHGNDTVSNRFSINTFSLAKSLTDSVGVTVSSGGSAESKANAEAESYSASIVTGAGNDRITNRGLLTSKATAEATAVSVGLAVGHPPADNDDNGNDPPNPVTADKITSKSATNVTAKALGYGIDADGLAENLTTESLLSIGVDGLVFSLSRQRELASGNDSVNNLFALTVDSSASTDSTNASIQLDAVGSVNSEAKATAEALAAGIATGAGDDAVINSGLLTVAAGASADSVSLGLTASKPPEGETGDQNGNTKPDKTNVKSEADATATATAVGIDAEGKEHLRSTSSGLQISGSGLTFQLSRETESLAGSDSVTNTGVMTTTAVADSGAVSAGISINADGSVDSEASSRAIARSAGILTGGGADTVNNQAFLNSDSKATATALAVSVSVAQPTDENGDKPSLWEKIKEKYASANSKANAEATSVATGIDTEGDAGQQVDNLNVNISSAGLIVDVDRQFTSVAGNDTVTNSGLLDTSATARTLAGAADVKIETEGTASSETNATAKAKVGGLLTGGGTDTVTNSGAITASADAEAGAVAVSFTQPDGKSVKSKAESKATAEATATGIGTDGGRESEVLDTHLSIGPEGIDFIWHAKKTVSAETDAVANTGAVIVSALTVSGAGGAAVSMDGAAKADATASSTSQAVAVDTGGGGDIIENEGYLIATGNALSGAVAFGYGQKTDEKTKPKVAVDVGATSDSTAIGIRSDSGADTSTDITVDINSSGLFTTYLHEEIAATGDDIITNRGRIDTLATSKTGGLGVPVAIDGTAKADVNATAKSTATSIEGGGGDDLITSVGDITAKAKADAVALAVGVGKKTDEKSSAKTKVEAKVVAEAIATGIAGDGGVADTLRSVAVNIDDSGLLVEYADQKTAAAGDDVINNSGAVSSDATATSGVVVVAITIDGAARADANSGATAKAAGVDSGAGSDVIDNNGTLQVSASATSATLNAAVSSDGRAVTNAGLMDGGNKADASAVGINSGGGEYQKATTATGFIDFNNIGVDARYEGFTDSLSGDGADSITNSGTISASSFALAPEVTAGITGEGLAVSIGRTQTTAIASAIQSGNLGDKINNSGDLVVDASSTAVLANVAVTGKGLAVATNAVWDGGTKAEANALGIDADSGGMTTKVVSAKADEDIAYVRYNDEFQAASGADQVVNSGQIDATSFALAPSLNVAIDLGKENKTGLAAAVSTSSADAKTTAIRGGDGNDDLFNSGLLNATATATALSANVAVVNKGVAAAADAVWDGGTKAEATAVGIAGDGGDRSRKTYLAIGTDEFKSEKEVIIADGADNINNAGEINAGSTANAVSIGVAVAAKGIGVATSTASAESRAVAIDAGSGHSIDGVYNSGKLKADSTARAAAASVSVTNEGLAVSTDSVWDGGTKATAQARGIDVGAGGETLTNDGQIDALADAETASASIAVSMKGVAGASATATSKADAIAIDASEGNDVDTVINNGVLNVDALSLAEAASISVTNEGLAIASGAVWDGGTGAESVAHGIDVGDGGDVIENTGAVSVSSSSTASEAAVGVAVKGVAGAIATATSKSNAVALHAGDDDDNAVDIVTNSGALTANANAEAASAAVSFSNQGIAIAGGAVWDGGTKAIADAKGIELGAGADTVDNSGDILAASDALVAELAASVSVSGVAGATATSTGESRATAIHTGNGNAVDNVLNSGDLTATSKVAAATAAVSVTNAGLAVAGGAVWDGGTKGISEARGIYVGAGADIIENSGGITAESTGSAVEVAAAISVSGVAAATATSTGQSLATAIDASEGDDSDLVINSGDLHAKSTANAAAASVTVTNAGLAVAAGAVWDGGTKTISAGRGIDVGAGEDNINNSGAITAESDARAAELAVSVAVTGVAGAIATSTADSTAVAIDAGEDGIDDDTVVNSGDLTVDSNALAATATVSVTTAGVAVAGGATWEGGTKATSKARGIEVGEGADTVENSGDMTIKSNAVAAEAAVSVAVSGVAGGIATATSDSNASGIDAGDGNSVDQVTNRGDIRVTSHSLAATTSVSVTTAGVAVAAGDVWDGGTEAHSSARGIETGKGADEIINEGDITAESYAESASANVAVAVAGVAGAIATSSVGSTAISIDAGEGDFSDSIINSGNVTSLASAATASAAVSFTAAGVAVAGDSAWEGGTSSVANSDVIKLGAGDDNVVSDGMVKSDAISTASSASAAIAVAGVAAAIASADSQAWSAGINAGSGNDFIDSRGLIDVSSFANGNTMANADSKFGVSAAGNSAWDGGAKSLAKSAGVVGGTGFDDIRNSADMNVDATALSTSTTVTFTVGGVSASISTSEANAEVAGIDGGEDDDVIDNTGNLQVDSNANAISANLAIAGIGVAIAGDSVWDGGTTANSTASAIAGGGGEDMIRTGVANNETTIPNTVSAKAKSLVSSNSISVTGGGVSAATATGTSNATARAIDAGAGNDTVINASILSGIADAEAYSTSLAFTGMGGALASDAFWDGGTKATAKAFGIDGGAGLDSLVNLESVSANATSNTFSLAASVSGQFGLAGAVAASTSTAKATGLYSGQGNDEILSAGDVTAAATAEAEGVSIAFSGFGAAVAGVPGINTTVAEASTTGLSGGTGADTLSSENTATINLTSEARARETSVAINYGGGISSASAGSSAIATSIGFDGGADNDLLVNAGHLMQSSVAKAIARSIQFTGLGAGFADANATSKSVAQAFTGGGGDDEVLNTGTIDLNSTAETIGQSVSVTVGGANIGTASAESQADGVGIAGDSGMDRLSNAGELSINTLAKAKAASISAAQLGYNLGEANSESRTDITGISGGIGADVMLNSGLLDIDAAADATATSIAASQFGYNVGKSNTIADLEVAGVSGGDGNDTLINSESGVMDILAKGDARSVSVSITVGGVVDAEAASLVRSDATGLHGGTGDDEIFNEGMLGLHTQLHSTSTGASVSFFGVSTAKAGTEIESVATGIDGGDGADTIINTGTVRVGPGQGVVGNDRWMSILRGTALSGGLAGLSSAEASAFASSTSTGVNGGEGTDYISNQGDISVIANSLSETGAAAISIFGSSKAAGESGAFTLATGLFGGLGNDYVETLAQLQVEAESRLIHNGASFTFGGSSDAESLLEARTQAVGIDGGDGDDSLLTEGDILVNATSTMSASNGASATFGSSSVAGKSGATTRATGIFGGDGNDIIDSSASITLNAFSDLELNGSSFSMGGSSSSAGQLAATTQAEALVGGEGDDQVVNRGVISIKARSEMTSKGKAETGFGSSDASNVSGGVTGAAAMRGGEGDDLLENSVDAIITIDASTKVDADAITYSFAGGTDAGNLLTGLSSADGLTGGAGNDQLSNNGNLNVTANSELTARGGSKSTFTGGSSTAAGKSAAGAEAVGMNGGEGDDLVVSAGDIDVRAKSIARANNNSSSSASFTSDQKAWSISETTALATGISGGSGNDTLVNAGNLTVLADSTAYSFAYANGATISFDGDAESSSTSTATATATGFSAGDGNVVVQNDGQLTVTATAGTAEDLVTSLVIYRLQGDYKEDEPSDQTPIAKAVKEEPDWNDADVKALYSAGDILYCTDDACIQNPGINSAGNHYRVVVTQVDHDNDSSTAPIDEYSWALLNAVNDLPDLSDPVVNAQYVAGVIVACTAISCREEPSINSSGTYWKVVVTQEGDPPVDVYSWQQQTGLTIEVSVDITEASFPTYAAANANGLDGDGVARASGVTTASAHGVQLGNGNNTVVSNDMIVNAIANSVVNSASDGDVFGDSKGYVRASATAQSYGIETGDGDDQVLSSGTMAVTATPTAQGYSAVSPGDGICIWFFGWWCAGAGTPDAEATATFTAEASGILAGNGNNVVTNNGDIIVTAAPDVAEDLRRDNKEYAARTEGDSSPAISVVSNSTAIGIRTGTGNDSVTNNGKITVEAKDILSGCAEDNCGLPTGAQATLSATGIMTDDGDDLVVNNGTISAQIFNNNNPTSTIAITTGDGDDLVILADGSKIIGNLDLGQDNDTLHLIGNPKLHGTLTPGTGMNSLVFEGPGYFANSLAGFNDQGLKYGSGTYTIPNLPTMQNIEITEGVLKTESDYTFANDGLFQTAVNSDGSFGKLHVVGSTYLDGSLTVFRDTEGPYFNEARYGIIEAEQGVSESFADVTLPAPTQLLTFEMNQYPTLVEVEVHAESFTTVATSRLERTLAGYMDDWLPIATGDLKNALAEFQILSGSEFAEGFQGFSPGQYDSLSLVSADTARQLNRTLLQRAHNVRLLGETTSSPGRSVYFVSGEKPVLLAFNGPADSIGQLYPSPEKKAAEYGLWLESFGQWGNQDQDSGFVGYDSDAYGVAIGLDKLFRDRYLVGFGFGYANTNIDLDKNQGDGEINSYYGSLYGSFFNEKGYFDGILSYGRQDYNSRRRIVVGSIQQTAHSDHDGVSFSAMVEGGLNVDHHSWVFQPFTNLQYLYLNEDGFTEKGAGGLNQKIESRETNVLLSELGLRISKVMQLETGLLIPEASLAWLYDFNIDDRVVKSSFTDQPGTAFSIDGNDAEQNRTAVGIGITFHGMSGFKTSLKYTGEFRDGYTSHGVTGALQWEF